MVYDQLREQEKLEIELAKQREGAQEKDRLKSADSVEFDRLDRLMKNEDFNWFVAKHWLPLLTEAHDESLNTGNPSERRNEHAHRHDIANTMLMTLQIEHQRLKVRLEEE